MSHLRKVAAGQKLEISAQAWNTLMDVANDWLANRQGGGRGNNIFGSNNTTILIKNSSGSNLERFDVLGIDGIPVDPTDNEGDFLSGIVFSGSTPATASHASGKICILAEPIANGKIGRAWTAGVCHAWVNIVNETDTHADLINGDATKLQSCNSGPCVILWKESGTGDKWSIVRFGIGSSMQIRRAVTTEAAGADNTITADLYDSSGQRITSGDGHNITVYCSIAGGTALNAAVPRLENDMGIVVFQYPFWTGSATEMRWGCDTIFQASQDCS